MRKFLERGKKRFLREEGKPIVLTSLVPQEGDEVIRGRRTFHVRRNGSYNEVDCCGGTSHLMRSRATAEGGRQPRGF
ncbi:hypothetical protein DRH13_00390 [Candidatus Woesebacteria bacterium]|nr:MAG: hypothetical protein DRH13_00390 [Candidatus Woesebacteria bacterium]